MVLVGAGCAATATDDPSAVASAGPSAGAGSKGSADDEPTTTSDSVKKPVKMGKLPFKGKDGTIRQVAVEIRGGRAWIGDMGFGPADDMTARSYSVSDTDRRWPDARVPYCFYNGDDTSIRLPEHTREGFREAARYIETHVPSLRFVERACSDAVNLFSAEDYLYPTPGDGVLVVMKQAESGGHAEVGYENTSRSMTLSDGIGEIDPDTGKRKAVSTVVHELGHTLGLRHEHQRPDRDTYVQVCPYNIPEDKEGDYEILDPSDNEMLAPYDYFSRMHYTLKKYDLMLPPVGCEGYAMYPRLETLPEVPGGQHVMGGSDLSKHDMNTLMLMYGPGLGNSETDDRFGTAIAVGDFDLDGYEDVVVGGPGEKIGSGEKSGTVYAYKGTYRSPAPWKLLRESAVAAEEDNDHFGAALAVGDFVRQTGCTPSTPGSCELPYPDLAVGVPGKRDGTKAQIGAVMIYMGGQFKGAVYRSQPDGNPKKTCSDFPECRGTPDGPLTALPVILRAADARGVVGAGGDLFGHSLAAGDFDGDGEMDLAVGAPGASGVGRVFIYRGVDMKNGLFTSREIYPVGAANVAGAKFGWSLAAGDFDLDGKDDLAVGAPGAGPGQVVYFKGQAAAPVLTSGRTLLLPAPTPTNSAQFGFALSANHLMNTNRASLVVGAPNQMGTSTYAGAAHLYTWGPIPSAGPPQEGLAHRQTILSNGGRGERFGHSVLIYSPIGTTWNDVAIGAPGRNSGRGGVSIYDATSATNLAALATLSGSGTDSGYGSALATGNVKISIGDVPGLPTFPNATLFVGSPLSMSGTAPAGRAAGIGFMNDNPASPMQIIGLSQTLKSPYTR